MSELLSNFEALAEEMRSLRVKSEQLEGQLEDTYQAFERERAWRQRLEEKIRHLEDEPVVMDGWDEKFCFDKAARMEFMVDVKGRKRLRLKVRGVPQVFINSQEGDGKSLLREALSRASQRKLGAVENEVESLHGDINALTARCKDLEAQLDKAIAEKHAFEISDSLFEYESDEDA